MSIAQRALKLAMRPLLNERYQTGLSEGRVEGHIEGLVEGHAEGRAENHREWEEWLERQRDAGVAFLDDYPTPGTAIPRGGGSAGGTVSLGGGGSVGGGTPG